jgi:hypothetical protein
MFCYGALHLATNLMLYKYFGATHLCVEGTRHQRDEGNKGAGHRTICRKAISRKYTRCSAPQ